MSDILLNTLQVQTFEHRVEHKTFFDFREIYVTSVVLSSYTDLRQLKY